MLVLLLYLISFFAIPVALIALLGVSIYRFISAKNKNKHAPGTYSPAEIKKRKTWLIIAALILVVFVAVVIGSISLLSMAITFM